MSNIEATLTASQLRWTGHIIRIYDRRLPKTVFYREFAKMKRLHGGQRLRYKDIVKRHLKAIHRRRHLGDSWARSTAVEAGHSQRKTPY